MISSHENFCHCESVFLGPPGKAEGFVGERRNKGVQQGMPSLGRLLRNALCDDSARQSVFPNLEDTDSHGSDIALSPVMAYFIK